MLQRIALMPALLFAIGAGCAPNRQGAPVATLPTPLVSALIDSRGAPSRPVPIYAVGTLPPRYPATLVPSGPVRVVGGMTTGDEIVVVFADSTRRLPAVFEDLFEQAGYTRPPPTPGSGFSSGSGPYSSFCGDGGTVSAEPLTGSIRGFTRVSFRRARGRASCRMFDRTPTSTELKVPVLKPPAGVHVRRSGGAGSNSVVTATADVTGVALVPATILAHYAGELVAAGWTTEPLATSERATAQGQPASIPTVVAQAMAFEPEMLGRPKYFSGQTPTDWPSALVPPGATIVGGGVVGDSTMFRMETAVFNFPSRTNTGDVMRTMLAHAGYTPQNAQATPSDGGFVETAPVTPARGFCKGSTAAAFSVLDSTQAPLVVAVVLLEGEAGRQSCSPRGNPGRLGRPPVTVPRMVPPRGVMVFGGGSSWSGSSGTMESALRTTMPVDSILPNYVSQLVAGGWKAIGRPTIGDGVGVQRFTFREDQQSWASALIILTVGDKREVLLRFTASE